MTPLLTKPKPGAMINPLHPLARGLVGCWLFNEGSGSRAYDISGKNNHGVLTNMAVNSQISGWVGSKYGGGVCLDGTNDTIIIPNSNSLNVSADSFSVSVRFKSNSVQSSGWPPQWIITKGTANGYQWGIGQMDGGILVYIWTTTGHNWLNATGSTNLIENTWYHIVAVFDKANECLTLYLDSVVDAMDDTTNLTQELDNTADVVIGHRDDGVGRYFNGEIDNVSIYNRNLFTSEVKQLNHNPFAHIIIQSVLRLYSPPTEVIGRIPRIQTNTKPKPGAVLDKLNPINEGIVGHWLMNEGSGSKVYDISGKNNHGTLTNMSTNDQSSGWSGSKFGGGLSFDGTDDYINCDNNPSLNVTTGFSINIWIKPKNVTLFNTICAKLGIDDAHSVIYFYISNNQAILRLYDSTGAYKSVTSSTIYIDTWYNIIGIYDGYSMRLYVDNVLVDTELNVNTININNNDMWIGNNERWGGEAFDGQLDSVQIYNKGLLPHEIKQLYEQPFAGILQPSLYFTTAVSAGWTGIINGVTNPSHICGVSVSDILKVNGVASST